MLGLSSALQFVIEGLAIALGMALSGLDFSRLTTLVTRLRRRKLKTPDVLSS
jgi:hypothetical protein